MEKTLKKMIDTHHLFVDFHLRAQHKVIYMKQFLMCKMNLRDASCAVLVLKYLHPSDTKRVFKLGDSLLIDFNNLMIERIIRVVNLRKLGIKFV